MRKFARTELAPGYLAHAKSEAFPWEEHASLGVLGLLAGPDHKPLPTDDFVATGLVVEELAFRATATADGDDYVISGGKTSVTMLAHPDAILLVARTVRDGAPVGVSRFLVPLDLPGIATSPIADTGWLPMGRGVLHLDGVRVPASALVGTEGAAFRSVLGGFDFTRPLLALTGIVMIPRWISFVPP